MRVSKEHAQTLLASLLWLTMVGGCATATMPEFTGTLGPREELLTLATRPGVTVRVLLMSPTTDPKAIVVYFPGGGGTLVGPDGRLRFGQFLSRLAEQPFITAALDMPSDHAGGIAGTDPFITSKGYLEDVKIVINFLRQRWTQPLFLVGHSGGTTSVGHFGAVLKDHRIAGLVLLAAISRNPPGGVSLANLPLHEIEYPVLFVHHKDDQCVDTAGARQQAYRLIRSPKVSFIEVVGGDPSRAHECSPFAARRGPANYGHFFAGKEREVFRAISDWIIGKPVPERIGP